MDRLSSIGQIFTGGVGGTTPPFAGGAIPGISSAGSPLWQKLVLGGMLGAGELGSILQGHQNSQYAQNILKWQQFVTNLAKNPAQLSAMINSATRPLSNALVQNVTNSVQGDLAQRGLGTAPGIFGATESQALAPFVQQEQSLAQNAVLDSLRAPYGATPAPFLQQPSGNPALMAQFLRLFQRNPQSQGLTLNPNDPNLQLPTDIGTIGSNLPLPTIPSDTGGDSGAFGGFGG